MMTFFITDQATTGVYKMSHSDTIYYLECKTKDGEKVVPTEPGGQSRREFFSKKEAIKYLESFLLINPQWALRIVREVSTYTEGEWIHGKYAAEVLPK